jgi:hypothetical protein
VFPSFPEKDLRQGGIVCFTPAKRPNCFLPGPKGFLATDCLELLKVEVQQRFPVLQDGLRFCQTWILFVIALVLTSIAWSLAKKQVHYGQPAEGLKPLAPTAPLTVPHPRDIP